MEAGMEVITPHCHPFQGVAYDVFLRLFEAKSGIPSTLVNLQIVLCTISVSAFAVYSLLLQFVKIDIVAFLDSMEMLFLQCWETEAVFLRELLVCPHRVR